MILPFTVLRRLDCVLESTKDAVLARHATIAGGKVPEKIVMPTVSGQAFYNTSPYDLKKIGGDPTGTKANLLNYIGGFSENVRDIFDRFDFLSEINKLDEHELLYLVTQKFAGVDLDLAVVSNIEMGLMFEELIRKFAETSNETAGEHFTPREVIRLMVNLLFTADDDALQSGGVVRSVYDPTAGTGGMLSVADEHLRAMNPKAKLVMYGQEINPASYAICKADMVIKGQDVDNIVRGDMLTDDGFWGRSFDYCPSNPAFGVEWKKAAKKVREEHALQGFNGRFVPGLPRVSDGSLLFLMHLIKKMRPKEQGGGRIGIVLNGSPLFTGGTGPRRTNCARRWPLSMQLRSGPANRPSPRCSGPHSAAPDWPWTPRPARNSSRRCPNGTTKRNPSAGAKGKVEPDPDLRDTENVPLAEDVEVYLTREVLPHVPDAWIDHTKTKTGYEIPFTRHFYKYVLPRDLAEIDKDLNQLVSEITALLAEVEA